MFGWFWEKSASSLNAPRGVRQGWRGAGGSTTLLELMIEKQIGTYRILHKGVVGNMERDPRGLCCLMCGVESSVKVAWHIWMRHRIRLVSDCCLRFFTFVLCIRVKQSINCSCTNKRNGKSVDCSTSLHAGQRC